MTVKLRHAARLGSSDRLQRVLSLLLDGNWHSTRDIQNYAYVCAAGECASELRAPINGIPVECKFIDGNYHYRLGNLEVARQRYRDIKDGAEKRAEEQGEKPICHPAPLRPAIGIAFDGRLF